MSTSPISDRKREANRLNARQSTGPRTPRGKAIAAANALRHGLFAKDLLLPGESGEQLLKLKASFVRRFNPRDEVELELVERAVSASWKLRRLQRFEALLYQREAQAFDEDADHRERHGLDRRQVIPGEVAWQSGGAAFHQTLERLAAQEHRLENALHRTLRQLAALQKQQIDEPTTEFAAETVDVETRAQEKWQSEATEVGKLFVGALLADAKCERAARQEERAIDQLNQNASEECEEMEFDDD